MIDALFTLINAFIFWGLAAWFMYHFVLPRLVEKFLEKKEKKRSIDRFNQQALAECRRLHEDLKNQEIVFSRLDEKIMLWRKKVEESLEHQKEHFTLLQNARIDRRNEQMDYLVHYKIAHTLFPEVFSAAETDLKHYFSSDKTRHAYQKKVINLLEERSEP